MPDAFLMLNDGDLPSDLFSLTDNDFYQFVQKRLGVYQARLIEIRRISCMSVFLMTDDICDILELDVDCDEFDDLKNNLCFRLRDGTFLVKTGIRSSFECLKKSVFQKAEEKAKQKSKRKSQQITESQTEMDTSTCSSISSSSMKSTSNESYSSTSFEAVFEMEKQYLLNLINKWCLSNKENLNINHFNLVEGIDFRVNFRKNNNEIEGDIVCKCGVMTKLPRCNGQLQLSNYYKHLKDTRCSFMKEIRKKNNEITSISSSSLPHTEPVVANSTTSTNTSSKDTLSAPSVTSKRGADDLQSSSSTRKRRRFIDRT